MFDYNEIDLAPLTVQPSLQFIQFKVARSLETLDGMANFPTLTTLKIAAAPKLSELDALPTSRATLRELDLEQCRDIYDIDEIGTLAELRFLGLSDCGQIPSLRAIGDLALLERLYAWGTTRVEDRDLSPLLRLSRLREIRMRDRREYQPSLAAIQEQLGIA